MNYTSLQTTAANMIADFGMQAIFTREQAYAYDPVIGDEHNDTIVWTGHVVRVKPKKREMDTLQKNTFQLIAQGAVEPKIGDMVTVNDEVLRVLSVESVSPSTVALIYKLTVAS